MCEYIYIGLTPVAFVDHSGANPVLYFVHTDQVMRPRKLTDASKVIVWDRVATPFGEEVQTTGTLTQNVRFPGQTNDSVTALDQNWHREYDPSLGRYVQSDPIGLIGGVNTYAYVKGNPLTRVDVEGLQDGPGVEARADAARHSRDVGRFLNDVYQEQRDLRRWGHENFGGQQNSSMRHCTVSCVLASKQGTGLTRGAGVGNELQGLVLHDIPDLPRRISGERPWAFSFDDLAENERGFSCQPTNSCGDITSEESAFQQCMACCAGGN